jgi:hypothetical protein
MLRAECALPVPADEALGLDTNPTTATEQLRVQLAEALTSEG